MTFRHPANKRRDVAYGDGMFFFTRPVGAPETISEAEYGDGMFFFTQPVGAPEGDEPSYGDGMFFFTQPVGAPDGAATVPNGAPISYGAAKPGALTLKPGAATLTKPTGGRAAPQISADAYKAFEKAAFDVGVWQFWTNFWGGARRTGAAVSGTQSGQGYSDLPVSEASQTAYADASAKLTAARTALEAAQAPILKGVSSDTATLQAFQSYKDALIQQGWYAQAFRSLSGSTRTASKLLTDAVLRDFRSVLKTQGTDKAVTVAQNYLLKDVQPDFTKSGFAKAYPGKAPIREKKETAAAYNKRVEEYNVSYFSADDFANKIFSSDFEALRTRVRDEQVATRNNLTPLLSSSKKAFEDARSAYYAGKTVSLPTQRGGGTRTRTDTTTDTVEDGGSAAEVGVFLEPAPLSDVSRPSVSGGPPADARTLEGSLTDMEKVGFITPSGTGEESFVSKYKIWIGVGAVAAIGGGYWWYTQKYLPSKGMGR